LKIDKEREELYREFRLLGIPVEVLHPLSNPALERLLDSVKNAVTGYRESARMPSSA
jgi:hypothetical protein